MPKLTLDGREAEFKEGETILEVAWREGIKIPIFCHHPKLKPGASCRMCLVEVEQKGRRGLLPACATPGADGMTVITDSEEVKKRVRARVLEFLLANHPTECPVCDSGGECDLQDFTYEYGETETLYDFPKREHPFFDVGPFLRLYPNRCVKCMRCVRLYQGLFGEADWDRWERGWEIIVGPGRDKLLESVFAGNMADVCPVGAITPGDYTFASRPWENRTVASVSPEDSLAFPLWLVVRERGPFSEGGRRAPLRRVLKIQAADAEGFPGWLSDRDRFSHEYISKNRLEKAWARSQKGEMETLPVDEALSLFFKALREAWRATPSRIGVLSGARGANEAAWLAVKLFREVFEVRAMDFRPPQASFSPDPVEEVLSYAGSNAPLSDIALSDLVLVFGEEPRERHPGLELYLTTAHKKGARIVKASPWRTRKPKGWEHMEYEPSGAGKLALEILAGVAQAQGVKVEGLDAEPHGLGKDMAEAKNPFILFPDDLDPVAQKALASAVALLDARFVLLRTQPNGQGFYDMGFRPGGDNSTRRILQRAADGEMEILVLWDVDPLLEWPDRELAEKALKNAGLVVWIGSFADDPSLAYADLALPVALPYESWGSRTSTDGTVVWHERAVDPPGDALPSGVLFAKLLERAGRGTPKTVLDVSRELVNAVPGYQGVQLPPQTETRPWPEGIPSLEKFRTARRFSRARYGHLPKDTGFSPLKQPEKGEGFLLVAAPELYRSSYYAHRCSIFGPYIKTETVEMNPRDAQNLGISQGDKVKISRDSHEISLVATLSERTPPGVLRFSPLFFDAPVNLLLGEDGTARVKVQKEESK